MRKSTEIQAEIQALVEADRKYNRLVNEGGEGYERQNPKLDDLRIELGQAKDAEFAAEWTRDVFDARRAAWNTGVQELAQKYGQACPAKHVNAMADRLGYSLIDLQRAKKLLGI